MASHASWIDVCAGALRHNVRVLRSVIADRAESSDERADSRPCLGAVLKGNAYGHGLLEALPVLHPIVDILYVIALEDALLIRSLEQERGLERRRVVVLGSIDHHEAVSAARAGVEVVVSGPDLASHAGSLREARARLEVHVHVDTGLGREGYDPRELERAAALLGSEGDALVPVGVCSHFANTEDVTEQTYAQSQLSLFDEAASTLGSLLGRRLERHIAASAAAMVLPGARHDVVRAGIAVYGLWPSTETRLSARVVLSRLPDLRPALAWRCRPQLVKTIPAGSFVGYGCTWRAPADTRIAVLPVGYYDGYPRSVSGRAHVLVRGTRCPVVGRVMMNHIVVDVTGAPLRDDETPPFTLVGEDGGESLPAEMLAGWAGTISYEIVARLGPHLRRVVR